MEDFEIIKKIGKGAFGSVYLAKKDGKNLAIKIYKEKIQWENIENSLEIAMKLNHPNLMICHTFFHDKFYTNPSSNIGIKDAYTVRLVSVLEYLEGISLDKAFVTDGRYKLSLDERYKSSLDERFKSMDFFLPQIINGLSYLHSKKIIHCDIKPENIMVIENNKIKIIDYDFLTCDKRYRRIGTPLFSSPELLKTGKYNRKTDNWSLGVTIYYCLKGKYPFTASTREELTDLINSDYIPDYSDLPPKYEQIIKGLLRRDETERMSLKEVFQII